jgi:voltage-gated potassium channel
VSGQPPTEGPTPRTVRQVVPERHLEVAPNQVGFPAAQESPWWALARRLLMAIGVLVATVLLVYLDRDGYQDATDPTNVVDLSDAIYYTTVTLSTTGYGDISPVSDTARMVNAFVITPLRVAFLVLLIGTTIEALTSESRKMFRIAQWRKRMKHHVVVVGYGTKGRSATESLLGNGVTKEEIVVVDPTSAAQAEANEDGLIVIKGDATRRDVLRRAGAAEARQIIVSTNSDDSTILCVLNARQLNRDAHIVAAVRESDNVHLVRQSGADGVVTSSDAVGRLLGLSAVSPSLGSVIDDLLTYGQGLEVAERDIMVPEVGKQPQQLPDQVIAVVRDNQVHRYYEPVVTQLARGDKVVVVRPAAELPWAPRPGTHGEDFASDPEE